MPRIAVSIKAESRYCVSGMTVQNRSEYSTEEENTGETYTGQMENEKGELIVFSQAVLDDGAMVERDTALKDVHEVSVRGLKLQIGIDDDGWRSAYWIDGNVYCTVVAQNLSEDELIRMIEGMEDPD